MKFLLTGGSGILGTEMQAQAHKFGIDFIAPTEDELNIEGANVCDWIGDNQQYDFGNIHGFIHAAAFTDVPGAETEKGRKRAVELNILGTQNMSELASIIGASFVYISTDYVYEGTTGNYRETGPVRPVNYYSMTKLIGESFVPKNGLIIRTSFKPNIPWPYPKAFSDLYTSADYVDVIVPKILDLVSNLETGVYNVGTERKSVWDLARRRNTKVKPMSKTEIKDVNLPSDVSMNLDKYNQYYQREYGCDAPDCCPNDGGNYVGKRKRK